MFGQIFERRRAYRDRLRNEQIEQQISQKRMACSTLSPIQAKQMLNSALQSLKKLIAQNMAGDPYPYLLRICLVAQHYSISDMLISSTFFPIEIQLVQSGKLPMQCSWAQALFSLAETAEDVKIQKQFAKILCIILFQLRMAIGKKNEAINIIKELVNKLPYHYIQTRDFELWQSLCILFGQTLVSASFISYQRKVIGQQSSSLLGCLGIIASFPTFFQVIEARAAFIETSLLSLSIIQQQSIHLEGADSLKYLLQFLIFQNFKIQDYPIVRNYQYIRQLVICGWKLPLQKFSMLQGLIAFVSGSQDPKYFQMLNCILCYHNYVLSLSSITFMANFIFGIITSASPNSQLMESKRWIILVLHRHLLNKGGAWDMNEANIIIEVWRKNAADLYEKVIALKAFNQESYSIFLTLIVKVIMASKNPTLLLGTLLQKLVTLEQFSRQIKRNLQDHEKQ